MPYIPVLGADGTRYFVAVTAITRDGVTEYIELASLADPITGLQQSITPAGTAGIAAAAIQGIPNGIPMPVSLANNGSLTSVITSVTVGTASTSLLPSANPLRLGFYAYNEGPSIVYMAYGPLAAVAGGYSLQIAPGQIQFVDTLPWRGVVSGIVGANATPSVVQITELSP